MADCLVTLFTIVAAIIRNDQMSVVENDTCIGKIQATL